MQTEPSISAAGQRNMLSSRLAAVAGLFYPSDPKLLRRQLQIYLAQNPTPTGILSTGESLSALIVPHAGYLYSAPVAATAFNLLASSSLSIKRILMLGPAHRVGLQGIALSSAAFFDTPLGQVKVDQQLNSELSKITGVFFHDEAHRQEHSLEVQLPFLQYLLDEFSIVPLVVGQTPAELVADLLERVWDDPGTLVLFSSDLSHYLGYEQAQRLDHITMEQLCGLKGEVMPEQACGCYGLNGLLAFAQRRELQIKLLDLRNSGDTAGDRQRVVGYGAWAVL